MGNRTYQVAESISPGRSLFDLSHEKKFDCDMGQLIPIMCDEAVPGDIFKIGNEIVIRLQPLVAPILHEINCYVHYFFVPYRLLWTGWEEFITGGVLGTDVSTPPEWDPTDTAIGSLWDFLGFPTTVVPTGFLPLDFPRRAYTRIYNEYYRDQNLIAEVDETTNEDILIRAWEKDFFTSALPFQQRGTSPALPVSGSDITSAIWPTENQANVQALNYNSVANVPYTAAAKAFLDNNTVTVDFSGATTFDIADLRLAIQIQKWMERNARSGVRYTEFLKAHFGFSPRDDRLQRPEYIGGSKSPIIVSEVLQTSESGVTAQGNLAGHGIGIDRRFIGKYRCNEFGLIMGILSIMPRSVYQQGVDRQWLRKTRYDYYFPEFANLSEQAIQQVEIFASAVQAENETLFGYQGRYDEMRTKKSMVCGHMRTTLDYWHISRQFAAAPLLNQSFAECVPRKDIFAVPAEPGFIVNIGNVINAIRPLPAIATPGLMDH